MIVRESIKDLLVPKTQEEVTKALDRWSLEEKIDAIENQIDPDRIFDFVSQAGANKDDVIDAVLDEASEKELREIIHEMVRDNDDVETIVYLITGGGGRIEYDKLERAYRKFIDATGEEELTEILNNMIMQHPEVITRPKHTAW